MEHSEIIAVASVVIAFSSFALQQYFARRQSRAEALIKICDTNRQLVMFTIEHPKGLTLIGAGTESEEFQRRFLQIWLNQIELMFRLNRLKLFQRNHWSGLQGDMAGFMSIASMREHWNKNKHFYASDFRAFVEKELLQKRVEAVPCTASTEQLTKKAHASTT